MTLEERISFSCLIVFFKGMSFKTSHASLNYIISSPVAFNHCGSNERTTCFDGASLTKNGRALLNTFTMTQFILPLEHGDDYVVALEGELPLTY